MTPPDTPVDDADRVAAVRALGLLDTPPEERFDRITRTVARIFDVPIALINLVDVDRQWGKSCVGMDSSETDRGVSFCAHAINREEALVVPDARQDPRFDDNPMVLGDPRIVFYAGQPLRGLGGYRVGTLCIVGHEPRELSDEDLATLADLGRWAEGELESVELNQAVTRIRETEARLQTIMAAVPDGIVTFDEDGCIETANPAAERIFGYTLSELRGMPVLTLLDPDGREQIAALRRPDERRRFPRGEVSARHSDGHLFPIEIAMSETELEGRTISVGVGRNITGRKAVERQLERLRRQNEMILASAAGGLIALDRDGLVQTVNPAGEALLGRTAEELIGASLHALAHHTREDGTAYPFSACPIHDTLQTGATHHLDDDVWTRPDGSTFHAEYQANPILEEGEIVGAVVTLADITERTLMTRVKDEFVSVVSHELRTPLTSIKGSLGLLAGGVFGALPPEGARMVEIAITNTDRLVRLINDVLDLERIGSGKAPLVLAPLPLVAVLGEAVDATAGVAGQAGVRLEVVEPVLDLGLLVDCDRIVQALTNLLGNAVKFSAEGSAAVLSASLGEDDGGKPEVRIHVADRGRGIPTDRLEAVFGRFEQVDASDAREKGGTGLGLAIVQAIAEQHGGRVWVDSILGEGSTFHLALPLPESTAPDDVPAEHDRRVRA